MNAAGLFAGIDRSYCRVYNDPMSINYFLVYFATLFREMLNLKNQSKLRKLVINENFQALIILQDIWHTWKYGNNENIWTTRISILCATRAKYENPNSNDLNIRFWIIENIQ